MWMVYITFLVAVRISNRYQSRKDWFAEAHAIKGNVSVMEVSQGSRSGSIYSSSNAQHSVFSLGRSGNFSFTQGSALLTYVSQVGPKSQRLHTHPKTTPASENCVYKHRNLCWMFQIQDITTSSRVWLVRLEKLCMLRVRMSVAWRSLCYLYFKQKLNPKWLDATLFGECSKTDVLWYSSPRHLFWQIDS